MSLMYDTYLMARNLVSFYFREKAPEKHAQRVQKISDEKENVVFLLWGGFAKKKGATINRTKHHVLETGHPSPLSANRGLWFGNKHFSKTNTYLQSLGKETIKW